MGRIDRPRVACVGVGAWGRNIARNLAELGALAAICDTDAARLADMAEVHPDVPHAAFEALLGDGEMDAVAIATPSATHGELVRRALLAGKDVFVEKPLCLSVEEGRRLVEFAERSERILMVGHLLWYHPAIRHLKELVDDGELGRIQYVYSNRLNLGRFRREENILWSFAPHDVSVILGLLEEEPSAVEARGGAFLNDDVADVTVSVLSFKSGVRAHIFVSWLHPFKEQKLVVVGDRKMAVFDDTDPEHKLLLYPYSIEWKQRFPLPRRGDAEPVEVENAEPLRLELEHFLECIERRARPHTDGREALRVLSVLEACQAHLASTAVPASTPALPASGPAAGDLAASTAGADGGTRSSNGATETAFVHPTAVIDPGAEVGPGTRIWHFSHVLRDTRVGAGCSLGQNVMVGPGVTVGDHVKIQNNVSVYEGVTLEDHVFVGPSAVFTNVYNPRSEVSRMSELRPTLVREGASLGANCTIVCGVTIGRYAFVGAGAVVLRDVPDHALVVGNPARLVGWMCRCGERIAFDRLHTVGTCAACGSTYRKSGRFTEGLEPVPGELRRARAGP